MDKNIVESCLLNTVLVENQWGKSGSGFLVTRNSLKYGMKTFLVTNKHVIYKEEARITKSKEITLHINVRGKDDSIKEDVLKYSIQSGQGTKVDSSGENVLYIGFKSPSGYVREHPVRDIDVLAIDVTPIYQMIPNIVTTSAGYSMLVNKEKIKKEKISIGDDAYVIGYPLGLKHHVTNFPLLRKTTIASRIGEELEISTIDENHKTRKRILRGFLIDGGTSPGSSGSPVVFSPGRIRVDDGTLVTGGISPTLILGIVAESQIAKVVTQQSDFMYHSGLALSFDADTIIETIDQFFLNV